MRTQGNYRLKTLILVATSALASCLLALALAALPAQAATQPGDLSISQTDTPDPLASGNLTYTLTVRHEAVDGCGTYGCYYDSGTVRITDTLPTGVDVVAVNPSSDLSCMITSSVTCTTSYLYDGRSRTIDIVVRPTTTGPRSLTNTATVERTGTYGYQDPNTANNSATATTQVTDSYVPVPDTTAPETTLTDKPSALSANASPKFGFTANEGPSTFECKLDANAYQSCTSPKQYFLLSEGEHTFQVRAKDSSGNTDQTPAQHTWTVDSKSPNVAFTERPGTNVGTDRWDELWVTNDRSPTWAWTAEDPNLDLDRSWCDLDEDWGDYRNILYIEPCSSPLTFEGELPDGTYSFDVGAYDEAYNSGGAYNEFEVDTVAPKFVSGKPTGRRVSTSAWIKVAFDDRTYESQKFVKIYRRGSNTPLALDDHWMDGKVLTLNPKGYLRRDTRYTVKVTTGVNDGANNLEAPYSWSFKTRG